MNDIELKEFEQEEIDQMENLQNGEEIALTRSSLKTPIQTLNLKKCVFVQPDTSLRNCLDIMLARHFGSLIIVENNQCVGIFTERDVLRKIAGETIDLDNAKVCDYMTPSVLTLRMNDTIESALRLMDKGSLSHICIVDAEDKPSAVLSIRDVIRFIIDFFPQSILNLPPHPIRIGTKHADGG